MVSVSEDSAYSFPLSNYPSSVAETRIAGDNNQVSEVTRQSDEKTLYKLKIDEIALNRRNITAQPTEYARKLMRESRLTNVNAAQQNANAKDSTKKKDDFFQSEFPPEQPDSTQKGNQVIQAPVEDKTETVLASAKLFRYKPPKFSSDFASIGLNGNVLVNRYQQYGGGSGPIMINSSTPLNGLITLGVSDLLEDIKVTGAFKIGTNLKDNEWLVSYQNLKRRIDWGVTYYRNVTGGPDHGLVFDIDNNELKYKPLVSGEDFANLVAGPWPTKLFTNLYQVNVSYPFDVARSIRLTTGLRAENLTTLGVDLDAVDLNTIIKVFGINFQQKKKYWVSHLEYVYDNVINPAKNIWDGMRYKAYIDYNRQVGKKSAFGPNTFNFGFDARYYYPIYRNFIWAVRAAGDFSWGSQKFIYYLGGADGWLMFGPNQKEKDGKTVDRYFNTNNPPSQDQNYAFQSVAVNMRGYIQNVANGNNAVVINSELRVPILSTFFDKTINNPFLRDLQVIQFFDFGTAWNGAYKGIKRPEVVYGNGGDLVHVKIKAGGIGPFAGGYGFGIRSSLLGYFVKFDLGWPMNGFFKGGPVKYFALGLDF